MLFRLFIVLLLQKLLGENSASTKKNPVIVVALEVDAGAENGGMSCNIEFRSFIHSSA
jgi:hypothetical protein